MNRRTKILVATLSGACLLGSASILPLARAEDAQSEWKAPSRAAKRKNPTAADAASIDAGKTVYQKECVSCHGAAGKGDGPAAKDLQVKPGDLSAAKLAQETDGELFWKITEGKKPMPSFSKLLSDDQRWNAVNYVRTLGPKQSAASSEGASK